MFDQLEPFSPQLLWVLVAGFVIAFILAFSVGANDVSNSFGTSVGSRVLTVTQACILATIFEMAGSCLLGHSVCDTFRKKMYDSSQYKGAQKQLMLGALACLIGSSAWNILATAIKMPISGTHSIVGATIGFSLVLRGTDSIRWPDMFRIVVSWFVSPLLSGLISSLIYLIISKTIVCKIDPLRHGLKALPFFYGVTIFINVASIFIGGPPIFGLDKISWMLGLAIAMTFAVVAICCVALLLVPKLRREILKELAEQRKEAAGIGVPPRIPFNFDNPAFKADEPTISFRPERKAPEKPKRAGDQQPIETSPKTEITLDVEKLHELDGQASTKKPPIAPKPAHLRRQMAQQESVQSTSGDASIGADQKFDEIDLSAPVDKEQPALTSIVTTKELDIEQGTAESGLPRLPDKKDLPGSKTSGERHEIARLFASLQIMTACFASFAHGSNDVSNAVAPLIPIWNIYTTGIEDTAVTTQMYILAFGSIGICTGLWAWGRAVMGTISDGITKITPSKGFAIELGAAISVLLASKLGMPISTTHCKVGSLVISGLVSDKFLRQDRLLDLAAIAEEQKRRHQNGGSPTQQLDIVSDTGKAEEEAGVDWKMFGNIVITWISTVPLSALASALVMWLFMLFLPEYFQ